MFTVTSEHNEPEDWQLAERARGGDEDAFSMLVCRHQGALYGFVVHRVGDDVETARDLVQEVFVRAWFALERARPRAKFSTWLFQIALNLCRDHAKSRRVRQARLSEPLVRRDGDSGEECQFAHPGLTPDHQAEVREGLDALDAELARLPADLQEAFILGAIEGRPHKEIAELLGISPKAVEVRIYRARKILVDRLAALGVVQLPRKDSR